MAERKRMLITGVSGLLGNNLARYFRGAFEVLGIYCTHPVAMDRVETRGADIEDPERLARIVRQFQPEVIIHCASLANIDDCEANRERSDRINVLGTRTLAECTPTGAKLVYISSDSVYDGTRGPWRETDPVNPLNYYGVCKYRGEQEAARAAGSLILRTNLFGWNIQPKLSLGEWVLGQLRSGQRLGGFTDARFSTLYTFDLARLMERAIARGLEGVYHCGCRQSLSKYDFAVQTARRFGLDESLVQPTSMDQFGFKAPRGKDLSLCVEKMERDLGQPLPTFEDSLDAFYRDEQEGLPASIRRHNARVASWSTTMGYGRQSLDESDIAAVVEVLCS
ncbi:MAG: sugar nucleotide-binding protein, partial [Planctomycetes bacterium]|nr:sugar nucleotide-binding protein [Planctomycetota bacterium]